MKYLIVSITIFLLTTTQIFGQTTKKVLFLGNSYTAYNNLPNMVSNMALSTGDNLIYDAHTPGGYRFINHATNTISLEKINANSWDYVVLQAQSQETAFPESYKENELYPYASQLSQAIRNSNTCAQPLFYMTWGRENGDSSNCPDMPWMCTYEGMDNAIYTTYMFMAATNQAKVSPVGALWRYLRTQNPSINLYTNDGSHPSVVGSYAAACAFYTLIYQKDPTQITWHSSLPLEQANTIKTAAKLVVFDNLSDWNFTVNPAWANFTSTVTASTVAFTNTSADYDSVLWEFGDGNTSTLSNPVHTYASVGAYTVTLTVRKCDQVNRKVETIEITSLATEAITKKALKIYPNPTNSTLYIVLPNTYNQLNVFITDIIGKLVVKKNYHQVNQFNMSVNALKPGVYVLKIHSDNAFYTQRIVIK
ncbi:PKD domain-containing protein [Bizionia sediminis]|uniref:PKD domain-containing protein n=1 Tax=Bizionia sediminis TaxID=1737064 RepID=A0ABW5KTU1_9FLAO